MSNTDLSPLRNPEDSQDAELPQNVGVSSIQQYYKPVFAKGPPEPCQTMWISIPEKESISVEEKPQATPAPTTAELNHTFTPIMDDPPPWEPVFVSQTKTINLNPLATLSNTPCKTPYEVLTEMPTDMIPSPMLLKQVQSILAAHPVDVLGILKSMDEKALKELWKFLANYDTLAYIAHKVGLYLLVHHQSMYPPTQKGKSIRALVKNWTYPAMWGSRPFWVQDSFSSTVPLFVRPCPVRPRHGFLDSWFSSRDTLTREQLYECHQAAEKADPGSEIAIVQAIKATHSAIVTPDNVTIGYGNDGATSGKDCVVIPVPHCETGAFFNSLNKLINGRWGISSPTEELVSAKNMDIHDTPYTEWVWAEGMTPSCVQIRDGVFVGSGVVDFIPTKLTVERVINPNSFITTGDRYGMLHWEELCKTVAKEPGAVINHVNGSLSSHYSIHGLLNRIPVITSRIVHKGDKLEPVGTNLREPTKAQRLRLAQWVSHLWTKKVSLPSYRNADLELHLSAFPRALATLHAQSVWDYGSANLLYLRADCIVTVIWAMFSAILGEMRHAKCHVTHEAANGWLTLKVLCHHAEVWNHMSVQHTTPDRHYTFKKLQDLPLNDVWAYTRIAYHEYSRQRWSRSYGGSAWANVAKEALILAAKTQRYVRNPTPQNWRSVMCALNLAVHTMHNGGTIIHKFMPCYYADAIALTPGLGFVTGTKLLSDLNAATNHRLKPPLPQQWSSDESLRTTYALSRQLKTNLPVSLPEPVVETDDEEEEDIDEDEDGSNCFD